MTQTSAAPVAASTMPPARRPRRRARAALSMVVQVGLIALGVFLGLAGEEWRQDRQDRRLATETLRRLRAEVVVNRETLLSVKDYRMARHAELEAYFAAPVEARDPKTVKFDGLKPPFFERTAWDFTLANNSLGNIDPNLAFALSRTYYFQNVADELGRGIMNAMYARPPTDEDTNFFAAVHLYYSDLVGIEPGLIATYDELLPALDRALGQ
jgi:hypothetical protein